MKSFVDANIWIPAAIKPGFSRRLLKEAIDQRLVVTSEELIAEVLEKLIEKFALPAAVLDSVERTMRRLAAPFPELLPRFNLCRDPDDGLLLAQALAAGCAYFVTNDKDVLVLGAVGDLRIVRPSDFAALLGIA